MPGGPLYEWFDAQVARYITAAQRAHQLAALEVAGMAARSIGGQGTGRLARDVSRVRTLAPLESEIGSDQVYARIQQYGGTISAKNYPFLYIRGKRGTTRSSVGGDIVAVVQQVTIPPKRYLDVAVDQYPARFYSYMTRFMPS